MALTLLEIARQHAGAQGLAIPNSIAGNPDPYALQIIGLLNAFNRDLTTRKLQQVNTMEVTFASVAQESQGLISTLAPYGFQGIVLNTIWDRTQQLNWIGGISAEDWQFRKASNITGPLVAFRLRNNMLLCNPPPAAGHLIAFEYASSYFVQDHSAALATSTFPKAYWTLDTDTCRLDDALPLSYLLWAWNKSKGFEYAEDFRAYERQIASLLAKDDSPQVLSMDDCSRGAFPGVLIPAGSWRL